jgi:hypothetical protein
MLRFDDQFPLHRKVNGLTDSAFRLHVEAIFWCARNLTDGFIAHEDLTIASRFRKPEGYVAECVKRGAWHRVEGGKIEGGCGRCEDRDLPLDEAGWLIHDFLDWQRPRSKVLEIKERRAEAGRRGGVRSAYVRNERKNQAQRGKSSGKPAGDAPRQTKPQAPRKQVGSRADEPPIPSPSKEGNGGERAAPLGAPLAPAAAPPPDPSTTDRADPDRVRHLAAEARQALRAASDKIHNTPTSGPPAGVGLGGASALGRHLAVVPPSDGPQAVFQPPDYNAIDELLREDHP